jgi:hypothetical protein
MSGYGGLPSAPLTTSTIIHTAPSTHPILIQSIPFPHSPSPLPFQMSSPSHRTPHDDDDDEGTAVPRYYKLSFPMFDGKDDPLGWLNRCEQFFRAQRTREADKVWLASFHMIGTAQHWYYMIERDTGKVSWPLFKDLCNQRFVPTVGINHLAELARLPFRSSVAEYQEAFLAKMAHVGPLSPEQQVHLFTGGLPESIHVDVELQSPQDLQRAMALARAYEQRSSALAAVQMPARPPRQTPRPQHYYSSSNSSTLATSSAISSVPTNPSAPTQATKIFKKLSPTEMMERRRQGLCYNCDEQYTRGHKCQKLFYLEETDFDAEAGLEQQQLEEEEPLISLHALKGIRTDDSLQIRVQVGDHEFTALIDTGSTYNFFSTKAAQAVELQFEANTGTRVVIVNTKIW